MPVSRRLRDDLIFLDRSNSAEGKGSRERIMLGNNSVSITPREIAIGPIISRRDNSV
jgi:hypothetical protein